MVRRCKRSPLKEKELNDPSTVLGKAEAEVRAIFKKKQEDAEAKLKALEAGGATYLAEEKAKVDTKLAELQAAPTPDAKAIEAAEKAVKGFPADPAAAKAAWKKAADGAKAKTAPVKAHAEPFAGKGAEKKLLKTNPAATPEEIATAKAEDDKESNKKRKNFLALVLCLMVGTAALPHILMRYYTTPSVKEARQSVFWSLFFIFLLYFTAPALAVLAKFDIYYLLVGSNFADLPKWVSAWAAVDPTLMSISDLNKDGIVQLAEITIGGDLIVLATPEIAGLPYVVSGLVAAGGLAAALSTADGLLLTIANALSHDVYYKMIDPHATTTRRLAVSKGLLLVVAHRRGLGDFAETGRHPVPGGCGILAGSVGLLPGTGAGRVLEARQQARRDHRHAGRAGHLHVLHVHDLPVLRRERTEVVGHRPDLRRHLRHSRRHHRRDRRQPDQPCSKQGSSGTGGPRALSQSGRGYQHRSRLIQASSGLRPGAEKQGPRKRALFIGAVELDYSCKSCTRCARSARSASLINWRVMAGSKRTMCSATSFTFSGWRA